MSVDFTELTINVSQQTGHEDVPAHMGRLCAMAERDIFKKLRVAEMQKKITFAMGSTATALPADCLEVERVSLYEGGAKFSREDANLVRQKARQGFAVDGRELITYPSQADVYLEYYAKPPALETAGTNWLLDAEPEIYLHACAFQVYTWKTELDKAQASRVFYKSLLDELQDADTLLRYKDQKPSNMRNRP